MNNRKGKRKLGKRVTVDRDGNVKANGMLIGSIRKWGSRWEARPWAYGKSDEAGLLFDRKEAAIRHLVSEAKFNYRKKVHLSPFNTTKIKLRKYRA